MNIRCTIRVDLFIVLPGSQNHLIGSFCSFDNIFDADNLTGC